MIVEKATLNFHTKTSFSIVDIGMFRKKFKRKKSIIFSSKLPNQTYSLSDRFRVTSEG